MSDKPTFTQVQSLKSQIARATDPQTKVDLYEKLVGMLKEPRQTSRDMDPVERLKFRQERQAMREQGLNPRTGKPFTQAELEKKALRNTPEKIAERRQKAEARKSNPEYVAKRKEQALAKAQKEAAYLKRIADLEAQLSGAGASDRGEIAEGAGETPKSQGNRRNR